MSFRVEFPSIQGQPKSIGPVEQAMLAMSYGVHVIGSRDESGSLNLMLADWVMQTSFAPRLVALSLENDARTLRYIQAARVFTVNMLHEKDGMDIAREVVMPAEGSKIRGRSDETASVVREKLRAIPHVLVENGCPVLTQALGWYSCSVTQLIATGDHTLVIAGVNEGGILRSGEMLIERDLGWEYAG